MARGAKKTRAADIRRRLIDDDKPVSPFASIKLVEKKEAKKKPPVKIAAKRPSEIVQGYDPSSSFADILYAYEHTGNPYALPSKTKKNRIASSHTDFGAILDKWEGRTAAVKPQKKVQAEERKSVYTPSKSFGEILSEFEGKPAAAARSQENGRSAAGGKEEDIPDDSPLFRQESDDEKRSPEASWSIFGGRNESFVRKEEPAAEKKEEEEKPSPAAKRSSAPYKATRSFADILSAYEGKQEKKAIAVPPVIENPAVRAEEDRPLSETLFRRESGDEKRSPEAVWSVFGNNHPAERVKETSAEDTEAESTDGRVSPHYHPSSDFSGILSRYEKKSGRTFDEILKEKGEKEGGRPQLTISKLRAMLPQATLDLHGYTVREAESRVKDFLAECADNGIRKISIITGKGLHSEDGVGVLRDAVAAVLDGSGMVSEKGNAPVSAGGSGALWIILKA